MTVLFRVLAAFLLFTFFSICIANVPELNQQELAWIADHPTIRVHNESDWPILRDILQKGMNSLDAEELLSLKERWLGQAQDAPTSDSQQSGLSGLKKPLVVAFAILFGIVLVYVLFRLRRQHGEKKSVVILLILMLLTSIIGDLWVMRLINENDAAMAEAKQHQSDSLQLVDMVRQGSDDLTKLARTFAVTGDGRYLQYFELILSIRSGDAPRPINYHRVYWDYVIATGQYPRADGEPQSLSSLLETLEFSGEEFQLLEGAKIASDQLAVLETTAIGLARGRFKDSYGFYTIEGEPNPAEAVRILHSPEYHHLKAEIMSCLLYTSPSPRD